MFSFNFVGSADGTNDSITIITSSGDTRTVNSSHPNFLRIYNQLFGDDPQEFYNYEDEEEWLVEQASNALVAAANGMTRLSERITFDGDFIYFDADKMNNTLSRHLVRVLHAGDDYTSLVNFMEKLADNPSLLSRIHVFKWLDTYDFTLTDDGDIIGYKAVLGDDNRSINGNENNTVYVDGVPHTGHIPNPVGAVVEIGRGEVDEDRQRACSYGLHVGTHRYAQHFGSNRPGHKVLRVAVNPRDVVSVPAGEDEKFRTARYVVLDEEGAKKVQETTLHVVATKKSFSPTFPDDDDETLREF